MKKMVLLLAVSALTGLVGCSKTDTYTPPASASGEDIFYANCTKCHKPEAGGVMVLSASVANKDAIVAKVQNGSLRMTAFPNIQGEAADRLAEFVLANSQTK